STKKLQPDPAEQSAATLLSISRTLVALSNGQSVPLSSLPDPGSPQFTPPASSVLVNALWLSSLIISVGVSLIAMLAKQWCHVFLSARTGSYHGQARRRQKRWDGIVWWRMRGVMDVLPLLMHLALALFAIGMIVYLWDINMQIAVTIAAIASTFGVAYGAATVLSFVSDTCPFGTVLSEPLMNVAVPGARILAAVVYIFLLQPAAVVASLCDCMPLPRELEIDLPPTACSRLRDVRQYVKQFAFRYHERSDEKPVDEELTMDTITTSILAWLIQNSENKDHVELALQAIAAASIELPTRPLRDIKAVETASELLFRYLPGQFPMKNGIPSPKQASSLCQALSLLLISDSHSYDSRDYWYNDDPDPLNPDRHELGIILEVYVTLVHQDYLSSLLKPNTFILYVSALMPAYHWYAPGTGVNWHFLPEAVTKMLSVIQRHNEQDITLRPQALTAFAAGCAHYLVTQISQPTLYRSVQEYKTVQQVILALLRLYPVDELEPTSLKYTIAVTLASAAAAARLYDGIPGIVLSDDSRNTANTGARLFANYIHRGAEPPDCDSPLTPRLLFFGLLGVSHMLPFASIGSHPSGMLESAFRDWYCRGGAVISLKTLPHRLTWDQLRMKARLACLKKVPGLDGSLDAENALAEYLRVTNLDEYPGPIGPDPVVLEAVLAACHARSTELWHRGLHLLGLATGKYDLDEQSLHRITSLRLVEHMFGVSTSSNPRSSPQAMKHLWYLIRLILGSTRLAPHDRLRALGPLLESSQLDGGQLLTDLYGLPRSIDNLQLEPRWYKALESMISSGHAPAIDGEIIQVMVEHYRNVEPTAPGSGEVPVPNNQGDVLQKWQDLNASYKSKRAWSRWRVLLLALGCVIRLRSKRHGDAVTSEPEPLDQPEGLLETVVTAE
ncbi:hypothetical protein FRC09_009022, partial [Ceratobasidium sp. 395]